MLKADRRYDELLRRFESGLKEYIENFSPSRKSLFDAMTYSLNAGGKRVRPVLLLAVNEMLGGSFENAFPFALCIEMIHTYSLIHDDLPAMDNDDFRRGKPSNHKIFGEAMAILAGDGLLNLAFEVCLDRVSDANTLRAAKILARAAGVNGMIAGQAADLECEGKAVAKEEDLQFIYENKTAQLISAPLKMASALNGGKYFDELSEYGNRMGYMFQLVDDILDVEGEFSSMGKTLGKDEKENKLTGVKIYGLDGAKERVKKLYEACIAAISSLPDRAFLVSFAEDMANRAK